MPKRDKYASPYGKPIDTIDAVLKVMDQPTALKSVGGDWMIMDELYWFDSKHRVDPIPRLAMQMTQQYEQRRQQEHERWASSQRAALEHTRLQRTYGDAW